MSDMPMMGERAAERAGTSWRFTVHKIIKATGTFFAAATLALVVAPAAGAATIHSAQAAPVAVSSAPVGTSITTAASHGCWRHGWRHHHCRDSWDDDGWDNDGWDGGGWDDGGWDGGGWDHGGGGWDHGGGGWDHGGGHWRR